MTNPKSLKKPSKPHYHVHRRSTHRKSPWSMRFVPPIAGVLTGIKAKRYPKRSFPKSQDSIIINTGVEL